MILGQSGVGEHSNSKALAQKLPQEFPRGSAQFSGPPKAKGVVQVEKQRPIPAPKKPGIVDPMNGRSMLIRT